MRKIPFIFSNNFGYRLARHFAFWFFVVFGQALLGMGIRPLFNVEVSIGSFVENILLPLLYLPGQLVMVYLLLYQIIPGYVLKAAYRPAIVWGTVLAVASGFIAAFSYSALISPFEAHFLHRFQMRNGMLATLPNQLDYKVDFGQLPFEFLFGLKTVLNAAGFAAAVKLLKYWYEKEYLASILQKEKLDAELQSLKAQLHPHFLFNTLNNIYSITENVSPTASDMLLKLSALLRYILYECNKPVVKLSQEFKLIEDYVALEKVRYTDIELDIRLVANVEGHVIAPLLLLPLVENCFKHGTSKVIEHPWINITTELQENVLAVKLINGKPAGSGANSYAEGIGLSNVKKRLGLLYPDKYELVIIAEEEVFIVQLKITLATNHG